MMRKIVTTVTGPVISVGLALLVTTLFLAFSGYNATSAYQATWGYGTTADSLVASSIRPSRSTSPPSREPSPCAWMGVFNIGVDGQYRLAALTGAVAAASIHLPVIVKLPIVLLLADVFRSGTGQNTGTAVIDESGRMPSLIDLRLGDRTQISRFLIVAILVGVTSYLVMNRSVFGTRCGSRL